MLDTRLGVGTQKEKKRKEQRVSLLASVTQSFFFFFFHTVFQSHPLHFNSSATFIHPFIRLLTTRLWGSCYGRSIPTALGIRQICILIPSLQAV